MDLRQMGSPYEKKYIELTEEDRAKVTSVYHAWQQEGFEEIEDEEKKEKKQRINKIIELGASLLIFIIGLILAKVSGAKKIAKYNANAVKKLFI